MFPHERPYSYEDLLEIFTQLRSPNGCPWDIEQTHLSLLPYLREESAEVQDAIINGDVENLREELGDLLLQIVFHAQIKKEEGHFEMSQVVDELCHKLVTRHPHVFATEEIAKAKDVEVRWEEIKKAEKKAKGLKIEKPSILDGIPQSLGALDTADKIGKRTKKVGFEWPNAKDILKKVKEELAEVEEALEENDDAHIKEELGDLFFTMAQLSRKLGYSSEEVVLEANAKFSQRFKTMESLQDLSGGLGLEEWEKLWQKSKQLNKK